MDEKIYETEFDLPEKWETCLRETGRRLGNSIANLTEAIHPEPGPIGTDKETDAVVRYLLSIVLSEYISEINKSLGEGS